MKRMIWTAMFSLGLASAAWAQSPPPATGYAFETIDPPGSVDTFVRGINARGDIVGRFLDAAGAAHGFLLSDGVFTTIDFPGATRTAANGINARGEIVGIHDSHSFLLSHGRFATFDFPSAAGTGARAINNAGDIVGFYSETADSPVRGFLLSRGQFTPIDFPGALRTAANGINARGEIVGDYTDSDGVGHGFLLSGGSYTTIHIPGSVGLFATVAYGNDNAGDVVGVYDLVDGGGGFLLRHGTFSTVHVPDSDFTRAFAINARRWIVGDYTAASVRHGFLATRNE
jgi:probable HAF family extracellular repeat protein